MIIWLILGLGSLQAVQGLYRFTICESCKGTLVDFLSEVPQKVFLLELLDEKQVVFSKLSNLSTVFEELRVINVEYVEFTEASVREDVKKLSIINATKAVLDEKAFAEAKSLKIFRLEDVSAATIPKNIFYWCKKTLEDILFRNTSLNSVDGYLSGGLTELRIMELVRTQISEVPSRFCANCSSVESIVFARNQIVFIEKEAFCDLPKLKLLTIGEDLIKSLDLVFFGSLRPLRSIFSLNVDSKAISSLSLAAETETNISLSLLRPLTALNLTNILAAVYLSSPGINKEEFMKTVEFPRVVELEVFLSPDLADFDFTSVKNPDLRTLSLLKCNITSLNLSEIFEAFPGLENLKLPRNPLKCIHFTNYSGPMEPANNCPLPAVNFSYNNRTVRCLSDDGL